MRSHDPTVVLLPIDPVSVTQFDRYAARAREEGRTIPYHRPYTKLEQLALMMAYAWEDNPFRGGPGPVAAALDKAA
jgi:hypothetical protein